MIPILIINSKVLDAVAMTADRTSDVIDLGEGVGFSAHYIWIGTPVGDLLTQGSNDGTNFVSVNTQAAGSVAGQHLVNVERAHYRYVRLMFDYTSGTGTLTAYLSSKRN